MSSTCITKPQYIQLQSIVFHSQPPTQFYTSHGNHSVAYTTGSNVLGLAFDVTSRLLYVTEVGSPNTVLMYNVTSNATQPIDRCDLSTGGSDVEAGAMALATDGTLYYQDFNSKRLHKCESGCGQCTTPVQPPPATGCLHQGL